MSWIIRRTNYDTDERDFLLNDRELLTGQNYFSGDAKDVKWGKNGLQTQFLHCDDAYAFITKYVREARFRYEYSKYEDYGYQPVWYE